MAGPVAEPGRGLTGAADLIKVTMQVTVSMTPAQREAYEHEFGVGFVAMDVAGRIRPDMVRALSQISWLDRLTDVAISDPKPFYEHIEQED